MTTPTQTRMPIGLFQRLEMNAKSRARGLLAGAASLLAGAALLSWGAPAARADQSPTNCTGSGLGISLFTGLPDVHVGDTLFYSVLVFNTPFPACDASEIVAGIVTPDGRTNLITLNRTTLVPGSSDYYANVVSYVVRAQDINPDGTVRATAFDNGNIHQNDTDSRGGGFQGVNTEVNLPCLQISAQCVSSVGENGIIIFTGSVTNCGNSTLVAVTITNFVNGKAFTVLFPTNLAPGQVVTFSGSWVPANPCLPSTATLVVQASDQFTATPRTLTNSVNITCQNVLTPGISVTQSCPATPAGIGGLLTYTGTVNNTGNVTLTNIVVINDHTGNTVIFTLAALAPGAAANFTGSYTVAAGGNCSVTSKLTASGNANCSGTLVSATATATCPLVTAPAIAVTQNCPSTPTPQGGILTYIGTVRNTGNITLTNVVVTDNRPAPGTVIFTVALLAPGAITNFTGSYVVPSNCCVISSSVMASGKDICAGIVVSDTDTATCPVLTTPSLIVTKVCPIKSVAPGGLMSYSGTVVNSGNIALVGVVVIDSQSGNNSPVLGPITLAPGETVQYFGSYIVPIDFCGNDTVTASGFDVCTGAVVQNSLATVCPVTTAPRIAVTLNCPPTPTPHGGLFNYSGTVSNPGNVTLTNVFVYNTQPTNNTLVIGPITLAPGASVNFSGSYTAPPICCELTDTVTARGQDRCSGNTVISTASTTCPLLFNQRVSVTLNCPASPVPMGSLFTFNGAVSNPGDTVLTNVLVYSDQAGVRVPLFGPIELAPGESKIYTGSYIVPSNTCAMVVSATGANTCSGAVVTNTASCVVANHPGVSITQNCPLTLVSPGGLLTYSGVIQNTGDITLTNIVVINNRTGLFPIFTMAALNPGASAFFTGSYIASTNCAAQSVSVVQASSLCGAGVTNNVVSLCPIATSPRVLVTVICSPNTVVPGGLLTFSGTVFNNGNIPLTNVLVVSDRPGPNTVVFALGAATLAPGATTNFTGSYTAPFDVSSTTAHLSVTVADICASNAVTNTANLICSILIAPGLAITKACPPLPVTAGGVLIFTGTVTNTGNVTLTNVFVVDNQPIANTRVLGPITLAPKAGTNFTASYTVPLDACSITDVLVVSANDASNGGLVTNTVSATCPIVTLPSIAITQNCPTNPVSPGGPLTYTGSVRNAGNITLTNIVVLNDHGGATPVFTLPSLAPGVSATFTGTYTAPLSGAATSASTVSAASLCGIAVTNSASSTCPIVTAAGIAITKACPPQPVAAGGLLVFTGTVTNTGNVALTNIFIVDDQPAAGTVVAGPITLAPGAGTNFTGGYLVPLGSCSLTDTLTATGNNASTGLAVSSGVSATCPIVTIPSIAITQNCPVTPVSPGGIVTYTGTINNAGNITLTNVMVFNNQPAANTAIFGPVTLLPGASANFTGSYTAGTSGNATSTSTVRAGSLCGVTVTNSASSSCPILTSSGISVSKACPPSPVAAGGLLVYSGVVVNTGSVTLTNVFVVDNQPAPNTPVLGPITLAPGAAVSFTGSYTVPLNACSASDTLNATGVNASTGVAVSSSVSVTCPVASTPNISVSVLCPVSPVPAGGLFAYTGSVVNNGNITLTNVYVLNNQPLPNTVVLGPITLAPGASASFSGSYTVPAAASVFSSSGPATFTTLNPVTGVFTARFAVGNDSSGLMFANQDKGYGATQFYAVRRDNPGATTFFDTISGAGTVTDRFNTGDRNFDALTFAAPDVGYGSTIFYYLRHDVSGVSTFGTITPGGVVGVVADEKTLGTGFDGLTFSATDVGYGANLFYYVRRDASGLSTFGSLDPAQGGPVTDRYTIGKNVDALVFSSTDIGYGANQFYYLRHDAAGISTFGTLNPVTHVATDRYVVGPNAYELAFTTTDAGFGANQFYFLRAAATSATNTVVNNVTATGVDICLARTVSAPASCSGAALQSDLPEFGGGAMAAASLQSSTALVAVETPSAQPVFSSMTMADGMVVLSWSATPGVAYTLQYTSGALGSVWTDVPGSVTALGATASKQAPFEASQARFYRVMILPQ